MAISFARLAELVPITRLKTKGIVGGRAYTIINRAAKEPITSGISISTINAICEYLDCQPEDIMEYVKEKTEDEKE